MPSALELAKALAKELADIRRDLHAHPEVGWQEARTAGIVADFCERAGLTVRRNAARTGVVAVLNPQKPGPALALRADMDALPVQEENDCAYASTLPGKAHLCGHDAHTAMLLGVVKILASRKERIPFPVRFIFQPAEEVPEGGAAVMIAEGHLEDVSRIFGLHVNPLLPTGTLGIHVGPTMASMDRIEIEIEGVGGHGAMPNLCRDPVLAAAEIILALQSIVARRVDPLEPAVLSITQMNAGSAFNIIPARARLVGTTRCLSRNVRDQLPQWVEEIAAGVAKAHGLTAKSKYTYGTTVLVNDKSATEEFGRAFAALGGTVTDIKPTMGGEDFSYYLEKAPGAFAFLGVCDGTPATQNCFHHPRFNLDEKAMPWGTAVLVQLVCSQAGIEL